MPSPEENAKLRDHIEDLKNQCQQQCQQQETVQASELTKLRQETDWYRDRYRFANEDLFKKTELLSGAHETIRNLEARIETQEIAMVCMAASLKNMTRGK